VALVFVDVQPAHGHGAPDAKPRSNGTAQHTSLAVEEKDGDASFFFDSIFRRLNNVINIRIFMNINCKTPF
jgi:hypothetical protein